jgi:PPP family 3-phenylpropionic acid transporter
MNGEYSGFTGTPLKSWQVFNFSIMTGNRIKSVYLLLYMGYATWRVFYNVFLEDNNFTGAQIGIINALFQSSLFIVVPLWGLVADKKGIRPTMRWVFITTAVLILFLGKIQIFILLVLYILMISVFYHPMGPLTDALAVEYSKTDVSYNYGKLRFWGSLGWALASVIGGYLFIFVPLDFMFPLSAVFFISAVLFLKIPVKGKVIYKSHIQPISPRFIMKNKPLLVLIIILTIYGVACAPIYSFINLYFTELKASNKIIGYAYAIQAFSELPFFIIGEWLMKRIGSKKIILISLFVMVIRMLLYGIFPSVGLGLALSVLQGMTLSFLLVGLVEYIHRLLPQGQYALTQSIIWGIYFGIGQTIGNLVIGYLKDLAGMANVMWIFGILTFIILITMGIHFYLSSARFRSAVN